MKEHCLLAKRSKCTFGKIDAVKNWPQPRSIKHIRSFLGLTGYYRRFVSNYGVIARPLVEVITLGGGDQRGQCSNGLYRHKLHLRG